MPVRLGDLLEHRLHALLEVAAVLRAREHGGDVERHQLLAGQRGGDISRDDALGQSLGDRGLADAGLADQDGVVLGPAGQDLHHAPDLVVAADHGVQPAPAGPLGEIVGVAGQRLVLVFRGPVGNPVGAPDGIEGVPEAAGRGAGFGEDAPGVSLPRGETEEEVLGGDVGIAEFAGLLLGRAQRPAQVPGGARGGSAADPGAPAQFRLQRPRHLLGLDLHLAQHGYDHTALLFKEGFQQMDPVHLRVLRPERVPGGGGDGLCGLHGHSVRVQHVSSSPWIKPREHRERRGAGLARRDEGRIAELLAQGATQSGALGAPNVWYT